MSDRGFAVFDTAIGWCGIAWTPRGIAGVALPAGGVEAMRARLARRHPLAREGAPPPAVRGAIDAITRLVGGEAGDLSGIVLDMDGVPAFEASVYASARAIPPGGTATYGEIAAGLGGRQLARDVGQALGRNPFAIVVPCHRVVAAGGRTGGFSARGGTATKLRLLEIEARAGGDILPLRLPFPASRA